MKHPKTIPSNTVLKKIARESLNLLSINQLYAGLAKGSFVLNAFWKNMKEIVISRKLTFCKTACILDNVKTVNSSLKKHKVAII